MSDSQAKSASSSGAASNAKKPRNPAERAIVWGLIGVMVVVIGIEFRAKSSYDGALALLTTQFSDNDAQGMPMSEARSRLGGGFTETELSRNTTNKIVELKWFSLFKDYRVNLTVEMNDTDPIVLNFQTPNAPVEELAMTADPGTPMSTPTGPGGGFGMTGGPEMAGGGMGGPGGGGGPGGSGPGGGGPRPPRGMVGLLLNEQISSELKLTEEQTTKLQAAAESLAPDFAAVRDLDPEARRVFFDENRRKTEQAVQEILDETQFGRIQQLELQQTGPSALERPEVSEQLGLSEEQAGQVAELAEAIRSTRRRAFGSGPGAGPEPAAETPPEPQLSREELEAQLLAVLTEDQQTKWTGLLGPKGNLPQAGGGGGGFGGPGGGFGGGGPGGPGGRPAADDGRPRRPEADQ